MHVHIHFQTTCMQTRQKHLGVDLSLCAWVRLACTPDGTDDHEQPPKVWLGAPSHAHAQLSVSVPRSLSTCANNASEPNAQTDMLCAHANAHRVFLSSGKQQISGQLAKQSALSGLRTSSIKGSTDKVLQNPYPCAPSCPRQIPQHLALPPQVESAAAHEQSPSCDLRGRWHGPCERVSFNDQGWRTVSRQAIGTLPHGFQVQHTASSARHHFPPPAPALSPYELDSALAWHSKC
eukprot:1159069-Pelagomonas_calceolata.AAC.12